MRDRHECESAILARSVLNQPCCDLRARDLVSLTFTLSACMHPSFRSISLRSHDVVIS